MNKPRLTVKPQRELDIAARLEAAVHEAVDALDPEITGQFKKEVLYKAGLVAGCLYAQAKSKTKGGGNA